MTPIPDQILTTLSLHGRMLPRMLSDIVASHPGCEDQHAVNAAIVVLIDAGQIKVDGAYLEHVQHESDLAVYFAAVDNYKAAMARRYSLRTRVGIWLANLWHRCWGGILLIIATSCFALGLSAQEGRWMTVEATAYCPCALCCDTRTERTANGTDTDKVPYGVAASPNIPLGAKIYVPNGAGYLDASHIDERARWFPVDDRGGMLRVEYRRNGVTRVDLRFKTHHSAMEFGRRLMTIYVEKPQ